MTPSWDMINLLDQLIKLRERFFSLLSGYNPVIKDVAETARWKRCTGQVTGRATELPCLLRDSTFPRTITCSPTWKIFELTLLIFMKISI